MFDAVRSNKKIIQIILALIILPFAFWGVESYIKNVGGSDGVATVGGSKISPNEFHRALQEQQDSLRKSLGGQVDAAMLDSPQLRRAVLDNLVNRRMLAIHLAKENLSVSNDQLARFIASVPGLQENGKFSPERYEQALANQGKSKASFENDVRQDMVVQQALMAVGDGSMPGEVGASGWVSAALEQREISESVLRPEQYLAKVKVTPEAIKAYYDANPKQFEVAEQVRVQYLVLNLADERRADHILVRVAKDANADQVKAAEAKAADILAKVKKTPDEFAKLAKQYSEDPGSAANGGDLDWFGRGMMTKPFEEAAFSVRGGVVPGLVRTDFGFHIIKVTGARPDREPASGQSPAQIADSFVQNVYNEQPDSLKPASEKFKLPLQESGWLSKGGRGSGPLASPKLMAALFTEDAIKNNRNTDAIEVSPNVLVAAHVIEHKPAAVQALGLVSPTIEKLLANQDAAKLAAKDGAEKLAQLVKGEKIDLSWSTPKPVMRFQAPNMSAEAIQGVFRADASKLPAYVGAESPAGYVVYRVSQVKPYVAGSSDPAQVAQVKALRNRYARVVGEEELAAWLAALKDRYPVTVNQAALEAKER